MYMKSGANLAFIDYIEEKFDRVFPEVIRSDKHLVAQGIDINKRSALESIVDSLLERFRRIDVLVYTVGGYRGGSPLQDTADKTWNLVFNLNVRPLFNLAKVVTPIMNKTQSRKIVHITAMLGLINVPIKLFTVPLRVPLFGLRNRWLLS